MLYLSQTLPMGFKCHFHLLLDPLPSLCACVYLYCCYLVRSEESSADDDDDVITSAYPFKAAAAAEEMRSVSDGCLSAKSF